MSTNLTAEKQKKQKQFGSMLGSVLRSMQGIVEKDENEEFIRMISIARQEMQDAQSYFDNVTATELVDHAIYRLEAAKAQYVYLIRLAKDKGLSVNL